MVKVSIVIPIYNAEMHLELCLNSLIQQTANDWECLLIDDCSTDSSAEICHRYISQYPSQFIYQKNHSNSGPGVSRNNGISLIHGKFFTLVDCDDLLPHDALETMINSINDADILIGNFACFNYGDSTNNITEYSEISELSFYDPLSQHNLYNACLPWARMFRSEFWKNNQFNFPPEYMEDALIWPAIAVSAKHIAITSKIVYYHSICNHNSTSRIMVRYTIFYPSVKARLEIMKNYKLLQDNNYFISALLNDLYRCIEDQDFFWQRYQIFKLLREYLPNLPNPQTLSVLPSYKVKKLNKMYQYGLIYFVIKPKSNYIKKRLKSLFKQI